METGTGKGAPGLQQSLGPATQCSGFLAGNDTSHHPQV